MTIKCTFLIQIKRRLRLIPPSPSDPAPNQVAVIDMRERVLAAVYDAEAQYPGEIWVAEGDDWVAVELIDPEELRSLEAAELAADM